MFGGTDRKRLARAMELSQAGLMMAVPAGVGVLIDRWLGSSPWGVIIGAVVGLVTGLIQLVRLSAPAKDETNNNNGTKPPT